MAGHFHLLPPPAAICIARPADPLDPEKALAAMRAALPAAGISILEVSRARVPAGEIIFPASQLRGGPAGQFWSGYIRYGGVSRFPIWARVRVRVTTGRVVALRDLPPGRAIPADAVEIQTGESIPGAVGFAASTDQVAGKWPRALIPAGIAVRMNQLAKPPDVTPGDTVQVDAQSGAAHLEFEARAEGSGATGDVIAVTNPLSHRRFRARVAGKGRVFVDGSAGPGKS